MTAVNEKISIAENELLQANAEYESTRAEYDSIESKLSEVNGRIESVNTELSDTEVEKQRLEGQINVFAEQIKRLKPETDIFQSELLI